MTNVSDLDPTLLASALQRLADAKGNYAEKLRLMEEARHAFRLATTSVNDAKCEVDAADHALDQLTDPA